MRHSPGSDVYYFERQAFKHWARWVERSNDGTITRLCGLTLYGSIPTMMMQLPDFGENDGVTQYNQDPPPSPSIGRKVQEFMEEIQSSLPHIYKALIALHLRVVDGTQFIYSSESRIAEAIYGLKRSQAHARFVRDYEEGYRRFSQWARLSHAA